MSKTAYGYLPAQTIGLGVFDAD